MRRVFPRFGFETAPIEWAFVIILCEGLVKNHRTPFFLDYHRSFLFAIKELLLNVVNLSHSILAGDCRTPIPPLRSREDQVSGPLDLFEHVNLIVLLHVGLLEHLLSTVNVQVPIYVFILSIIMLRGKGNGPVMGYDPTRLADVTPIAPSCCVQVVGS